MPSASGTVTLSASTTGVPSTQSSPVSSTTVMAVPLFSSSEIRLFEKVSTTSVGAVVSCESAAGELDIIAERFGTVAFVEVKSRTRTQTDFDPLLAVNHRRIVRAAKIYLARHPRLMTRTLRFDIILLAPGTWPRHLVNAFGDAD